MGNKSSPFTSSQTCISDITDQEIKSVVEKIGDDLYALAKKLGLTPTQISDLIEGREKKTPKAEKAIEWWQQMKGREASKKALLDALRAIGCKAIANEIENPTSKVQDFSSQVQDLKLVMKKLQEKLKTKYKSNSIPQPPGMKKDIKINEMFIDQDMEIIKEHTKGTTLHLRDLFKAVPVNNKQVPENNKQGTRILVEGDPGYGKTTLAVKLATDWADEKEYISSRFNLVILISLREMGKCPMYDFIDKVITEALEKRSVTIGDINNFLVKNKVLVILDGFDEISEDIREQVRLILLNKADYKYCILVTSRRGAFTSRKTDHSSTNYKYFKKEYDIGYDFCNTHVRLKGFDEEQRRTVLKTHFNIDSAKIASKATHMFNENVNELLRCPLFVFWLGCIEEETEAATIQTRTMLYKTLFNMILHKTYVRQNKEMKETRQLDIFQSSTDVDIILIRRDMAECGEMALERLKINDLKSFESHKIPDSLKTFFVSDIFVKFNSMIKKEETTLYNPIHKTFLEFMAAFYVWILFTDNEFNNFKKTVRDAVGKGLVPVKQSLFLHFLAGLMGDEAHRLFDCFSCWELDEFNSSGDLSSVLAELPPNTILRTIERKYYILSLFMAVLFLGLFSGIIPFAICTGIMLCPFIFILVKSVENNPIRDALKK